MVPSIIRNEIRNNHFNRIKINIKKSWFKSQRNFKAPRVVDQGNMFGISRLNPTKKFKTFTVVHKPLKKAKQLEGA